MYNNRLFFLSIMDLKLRKQKTHNKCIKNFGNKEKKIFFNFFEQMLPKHPIRSLTYCISPPLT